MKQKWMANLKDVGEELKKLCLRLQQAGSKLMPKKKK